MQWSMRWTPSLHSLLAYAGKNGEETPESPCFNKQQLATDVAIKSIHEFGKQKTLMSKTDMFSCVTSEKEWKEA